MKMFFRGLTRPSGLSVGVAVTTLLGLCLWLWLLSAEAVAAAMSDYLARDELDEYAFITRDLIQLNQTSDPQVVLIGTSSLREAVVDEAAIKVQAGAPGTMLTGDGMNTVEMGLLISGLPEDLRGVVVLGISPGMMAFPERRRLYAVTNHRVGIHTDFLVEEAARMGESIAPSRGRYVLDNRRFLLNRVPFLPANLLSAPYQRDLHFAAKQPGRARLAKRLMADRSVLLRHLRKNMDENFAVLRRALALLREHEALTVVVLEAPISPTFIEQYWNEQAHRHFQGRLKEFAEEEGLTHWVPGPRMKPRGAAFVDGVHMHDLAARERYTSALSRRLKQALREVSQ